MLKRLTITALMHFIFWGSEVLAQTEACTGSNYYTPECIQARTHTETQKMVEEMLQNRRTYPIATAYFNVVTEEFFVGDRTFSASDHQSARETWGLKNSAAPTGPGWEIYPREAYNKYMAGVFGNKMPDVSSNKTIYNNCVIEKSQNQPEGTLREIRAACRDISRNPSLMDRWRWGG